LQNYGGSPSENNPKSNAAARKALELDPTLARPHALLGSSEIEYDWDFAGGEAEFTKSFALLFELKYDGSMATEAQAGWANGAARPTAT
jgi:hypothetical protein